VVLTLSEAVVVVLQGVAHNIQEEMEALVVVQQE
jgi:hypothetical protein